MKQSNLLNAQFARRLFRTAFSSWQLLAVMLIVCMNVAVGSKLYAQSNTIAVKGKVMADGEPVIGATVLVKGVSTGTATDMDGNFSLNVASKAPGAWLRASCWGRRTGPCRDPDGIP